MSIYIYLSVCTYYMYRARLNNIYNYINVANKTIYSCTLSLQPAGMWIYYYNIWLIK